MPDLVIGSRRTGPPRTWRAAGGALLLVLLALVVAFFIYRRSVSYDVPPGAPPRGAVGLEATSPGAAPTLRYGPATLSWAGPIAVVRVAGDAHAIGAAHGRLLPSPLRATVASLQPALEHAVDDDGLLGGWTHGMKVAWRYRFVDDGIPDPHERGLAGMVRGAAASGTAVGYDDLLRQQALLDAGPPAPWTGEATLGRVTRGLTVVAPQPTPGRHWIARVLALPGAADGGDAIAAAPVVSFVRPEGRKAFASVGWAGLAGVVTGINQDGLAVLLQFGQGADVRVTRTARPCPLLAQDVLERAGDLDAAIKEVVDQPTLGACAFVLVDGRAGRWAVVERSPVHVAVRRDPPPAVGDVLVAKALQDDPRNDRAARISPAPARTARAGRLAQRPLPDLAALLALLRDHAGADDAPLPPGHRAAIADASAVHAVLLDPFALTLHVAEPGGPTQRFRAFDLRHELLGEGARPSPPPELPPADEADVEQARAVRAARAALRDARRALRDDDAGRADEHVARALVSSPGLPEALELAGRLARRRGDEAAARALWSRWLDGRPDDPGAEQEIRAVVAP